MSAGDGRERAKGWGGKPASLIHRGPSRQRYLCDVCDTLIVSYNIKHHYYGKTDWEKLEKLFKCVGEEALAVEMEEVDPHTKYMFFLEGILSFVNFLVQSLLG